MLETSLLSIRIKVLIFYVIYLFVFVLWHYTQQEDFFSVVEGLSYLLICCTVILSNDYHPKNQIQ